VRERKKSNQQTRSLGMSWSCRREKTHTRLEKKKIGFVRNEKKKKKLTLVAVHSSSVSSKIVFKVTHTLTARKMKRVSDTNTFNPYLCASLRKNHQADAPPQDADI